jgi:glutamate-1-semialdehyde 2,1-aminomutase
MGIVSPQPGFLEALREMASRCGALLIFDEVITGFRFAPTTYGAMKGVRPDLMCLGKIIGGGLPLGAVGGRADVMQSLAPLGAVYQAGTLSGNPLAVAAGLATLRLIETEPPYARLERLGRRLAAGLEETARAAGVPLACAQTGGVFTPFFRDGLPSNLLDVRQADAARFASFFRSMLAAGIYLAPSQFEVGFVSAAHTESDVDACIRAAQAALRASSASEGTKPQASSIESCGA